MSRERGPGRPSPEVQQELGEEELDPRVQDELEKLNSCTDEINRLAALSVLSTFCLQ